MAVTNIPNVQNWTVTPQNGQSGYFDLMNTWLGQSTLVIASLQSAIAAQNLANAEINTLASQVTLDTSTTVTAKNEAVSALALLSSGSINDTTIGEDKAYSNSKVNSIIKKRRNYLINGNFQFWDYLTIGVTSQTTSGYNSDNRWHNANIGSTKVHSRMTSGDTERALFESPYYSRTVVSSVVGVGNYTQKFQRIEDVSKLAGKTVTLSFWAKADSSKNIAIAISQNFGIGGSPSTYIDIPLGLVSLSTIWKKHTLITTIPSLNGKTLGTDGVHTSYTQISIALDAGSNFNTVWSNLGQQSGTFDIAEVKLEDGSTATDGWSPYDGEWGSEAIARMRYYESGRFSHVSGYCTNGYNVGSSVFFKVNKRTTPTVSAANTDSTGGLSTSPGQTHVQKDSFLSYRLTIGTSGPAEYTENWYASAEM